MKNICFFLIPIILCLLTIPTAYGNGTVTWWNISWQYRRSITIDNTANSNALKDYQVSINISYDSHMQPDFSDIRFTWYNESSGEEVEIPYWIQSKSDSNWAYVWIKVPEIPANSYTIVYVYYGNSTPVTSKSRMWNNIAHLGIYGGVLDYDINKMQRYTGKIMTAAAWSGRTCVLLSNGNVHCYGYNDHGEANDYTGGDAIEVSTGGAHTCALLSNSNIHCWGDNYYGQSNDYTGGDAIGVSAGGAHTCALLSNGNVHCWGRNNYGQANDYTGGDAIGIAAGDYHTCALLSNGNVHCWGWNYYGQANDYTGGDAIGVSAKHHHTCVLLSNGNVHCYGANDYGEANDYTGGDAIEVSVGYRHTCVLLSNGNVHCYGYNYWGQSNDYTGGDAMNPFRKYTSPEPSFSIGIEEKYQPPPTPPPKPTSFIKSMLGLGILVSFLFFVLSLISSPEISVEGLLKIIGILTAILILILTYEIL